MTCTSMFTELETERLLLRAVTNSDWSSIMFLRSDVHVNEFVERPKTNSKKEAVEFIDKINQGIASGSYCYWAIVIKENPDNLIGTICLWNFELEKDMAEIGYDLKPEFQSQGFMSEALDKIINYGFEILNLKVIEAYTHYQNVNSVKLLEKFNFSLLDSKKDFNNVNNIVYQLNRIL